jgi:hypothetical protein
MRIFLGKDGAGGIQELTPGGGGAATDPRMPDCLCAMPAMSDGRRRSAFSSGSVMASTADQPLTRTGSRPALMAMHVISMPNSTMDRHCAILDCRLLI